MAHLTQIDRNGDVIWWKDADGNINGFDDIPSNYPRWTSYSFDDKKEALKRFIEMTEDEGWECVEQHFLLDGCQDCPLHGSCDKRFEDCQFNEGN